MAVMKRVIRTILAGKKDPQDKIVFPVYNKKTGEEKILVHGVDAREHLKTGEWSSRPIDGSAPNTLEVIQQDANNNVVEAPVVPTVDEQENEARIAQAEVLTRSKKKKAEAEED
jgi:hypothetical protein